MTQTVTDKYLKNKIGVEKKKQVRPKRVNKKALSRFVNFPKDKENSDYMVNSSLGGPVEIKGDDRPIKMNIESSRPSSKPTEEFLMNILQESSTNRNATGRSSSAIPKNEESQNSLEVVMQLDNFNFKGL